MAKSFKQRVRERAGGLCEYCKLPESEVDETFEDEHIIAIKHDGLTRLDNLAFSCVRCNRHKGANIAGIDPKSGRLTPLFNPRRQCWATHFRLSRAAILGLTAVGRVTVKVLNINDPRRVELRRQLLSIGAFPPLPKPAKRRNPRR